MRQKMKSISGQRERFRATFSRTGTKKNYYRFPETTLLFDDVYPEKNGQLITDHLWFNNIKSFQAVNLEAGHLVDLRPELRRTKKATKVTANLSINRLLETINSVDQLRSKR